MICLEAPLSLLYSDLGALEISFIYLSSINHTSTVVYIGYTISQVHYVYIFRFVQNKYPGPSLTNPL